MRIWIDADSCPLRVRNIVCKAAVRRGAEAVFVANRELELPRKGGISMVTVDAGADAADDYIFEAARPGDLVISRDILFCARLVEAGVAVINDRGDRFDAGNIGARLLRRNRMLELRAMGLAPPPEENAFGEKEVKAFAACFDKELTKLLRGTP